MLDILYKQSASITLNNPHMYMFRHVTLWRIMSSLTICSSDFRDKTLNERSMLLLVCVVQCVVHPHRL